MVPILYFPPALHLYHYIMLISGATFVPCRYFPPALQLSQHGKYLLFDDAYERAATIGFRCGPR